MAVVVRHVPNGFTLDQYYEAVRRLEEAGQGSPPDRLFHVAFGDPDNLMVSDLWTSREAFEQFAQTLKPILEDIGVSAGEMTFLDVHNTIPGGA